MSKQDKMIRNVMENFDWDRVCQVMNHLNWTWLSSKESPTIKELKESARERINSAIEQALNPENALNKNIGWISYSGGFKATAWRTKKYKLSLIRLEFVLTEWEKDRKDFEIEV